MRALRRAARALARRAAGIAGVAGGDAKRWRAASRGDAVAPGVLGEASRDEGASRRGSRVLDSGVRRVACRRHGLVELAYCAGEYSTTKRERSREKWFNREFESGHNRRG